MKTKLYQWDIDMLLEDITFPLKAKGQRLIDDADNVILESDDYDLVEKLEGKFKDLETISTNKFSRDYDGQILDRRSDVVLAKVKVWERVKHKGEPQKRVTNIANYLTNILNAE